MRMTDVTFGAIKAPRESKRAREIVTSRENIHRGKTGKPVKSVIGAPPCGACRTDATADPCGSCPLYGAYLERFGLADEPAIRDHYDRWARSGGWSLLWTLHEPGLMRARLVVAMDLMDAYRGIDPAIVAHHLRNP